MESRYDRGSVFVLLAVAFSAGIVWTPDVTKADGRDFAVGMATGLMGGIMMRGLPRGQPRGGYGHHGGASDRGSNKEQSEKEEQSNQNKETVNKANENATARWEAIAQIASNQYSEASRNVDAAIKEFILVLEQEHRKLRNNSSANVKASTGSNINQVTEAEIRTAVDKAYQEMHLTDYDALAGELWTHDRLQVQILTEAETGVLAYFRGVGAKGPDMNNLQEVFKEAAVKVYARALELSEIIGVSRSFDHFIRTIYENSDQAPVGLWTIGADVKYERMLTQVINGVDHSYFIADRAGIDNQRASSLTVRLSRQFGFRFRARRALYDCLAAGYVSLISRDASYPSQFAQSSRGSRGAEIDVFVKPEVKSPPATSAPVVENVVESEDTSAEVWKRAQQLVSKKCQEITRPFAETALSAGLKPISARTDLAVAAGLVEDQTDGQYLQTHLGEPR